MNKLLLYTFVLVWICISSVFANILEKSYEELKFCEKLENKNGPSVHIGYWNGFRGRGNLVRLALELSSVPYTEHLFGSFSGYQYDFSDWFDYFKEKLLKIDAKCSPNLPFLVDCGENSGKTRFITETMVIINFVAKKYNPQLLPKTENSIEFLNNLNDYFTQLANEVKGNNMDFESVINSNDNFDSNGQNISNGPFFNFKNVCQQLDQTIKQYGGPFYFGKQVTIIDIFLYEYGQFLSFFSPGIQNDCSNLKDLSINFENIEQVSNFMLSNRAVLHPFVPTILFPSINTLGFDATKEYSIELEKLGAYLRFSGVSFTTAMASICLSFPAFVEAKDLFRSPAFNEIYGILSFPQLIDISLQIVGENFVKRLYGRFTRRFKSTQNRYMNKCTAVLTSGRYMNISLNLMQASYICRQFSNCFTQRKQISEITTALINKKSRYRFVGGSVSIFAAERYFRNKITTPRLLNRATRLYYQSKHMLALGTVPASSVKNIINKLVDLGAFTNSGLLINRPLAISTCLDYFTQNTYFNNFMVFKNGFSYQTLCEASFQSFYIDSDQLDSSKALVYTQVLESVASKNRGLNCANEKCCGYSCNNVCNKFKNNYINCKTCARNNCRKINNLSSRTINKCSKILGCK